MVAHQAPLSLGFCYTAKWFSYKYTHILHFKNSFPLWFVPGDWIEFPVLYSRTLLFIHPRYSSLHLRIPNSQSILPLLLPLLLSHLVTNCFDWRSRRLLGVIHHACSYLHTHAPTPHPCTTTHTHTQIPQTYTACTVNHTPHIHTYISHTLHTYCT